MVEIMQNDKKNNKRFILRNLNLFTFSFQQAQISILHSHGASCRTHLSTMSSNKPSTDAEKIREKLQKGELITRKKIGQRSSAWEQFSEILYHDESSAGYVICNTCSSLYVYDSQKTGTSNMVRHVCAKARYQPNTSQTDSLTSACRESKGFKLPLDVKSKLVDNCVDMCCLDLRPCDTVTGRGFLQVAQTLINIGAKYGAVDAEAIIPHRQTVCDRAKQQAAAEKVKLSKVLQKVIQDAGIAVSTNTWTDEFKKRVYTVLTCHYITEKWQLESRVLAAEEYDSHLEYTSENIHDQLTSLLMDYGIPADKVVLVCDQHPAMKAELQMYRWIPCSAHILNMVLREMFRGTNAPQSIKDEVEMLDCKRPTEECKDSWDSKVQVLELMLNQNSDIRKLLEDRYQMHRMGGMFTEELKQLIDFLTLFTLAISELDGATHPTIHMVLLWFLKLKKHCEPKSGDPSYVALLRAHASSLLEEKIHLTVTHKVATFLCPRFKSLKMLSPEGREEVMRHVRALIYGDDTSVRQNAAEGPSVTGEPSAAEQGQYSL